MRRPESPPAPRDTPQPAVSLELLGLPLQPLVNQQQQGHARRERAGEEAVSLPVPRAQRLLQQLRHRLVLGQRPPSRIGERADLQRRLAGGARQRGVGSLAQQRGEVPRAAAAVNGVVEWGPARNALEPRGDVRVPFGRRERCGCFSIVARGLRVGTALGEQPDDRQVTEVCREVQWCPAAR